jgi:aminoglycoside phosphotransferase (APT) family kinase protein
MAETATASDTKPVRQSEQLNWDALAQYLREHLLHSDSLMAVEQFPGGHSNLTYLLRFGDQEFVMRRPPFGPVAPKAHDMAREYRILAAVNPVFALAPKPLLLCEDTSVIGSIFYLMERRRGIILRVAEPPEFEAQPQLRRRTSEAMIDTLADMHNVNIVDAGLTGLGKPAGFVERQVEGWRDRWRGSQTTELPEMDMLSRWLSDRLPPDPPRPTLVHGDFKLDNVMLDANDFGRMVAVFDWEMSTIGDPLIDLGILLCYWLHTVPVSQGDAQLSMTQKPGWFTREEIVERYAARTGFDLSRLGFYEVFAVFKLAVVLQQIFYRYHKGQTDDARFATLDQRVKMLEQIAVSLVEKL